MDFKQSMQEQKEAFLQDLDTLIAIDSVRDDATAGPGQPFGKGPREALDAMLEIAKRDGFKTKNVDGYAGVIEYGDPENPDTFGMLGHLDIVPLGDGWTVPPLKLTEEDGYLFGRGVLDDKGPTMAAYYALKTIRDLGIPLKKRVMLVLGTDEESGMGCMQYYRKHGEIPKTGFVPDAEFPVIYGEKGGVHLEVKANRPTAIKKLKAGIAPNVVIGKADLVMEDATPAQEAAFDFYLKANGLQGNVKKENGEVVYHIDGTSAHASLPWLGDNAAVHLLKFAGAAYDDAVATELGTALSDWTGKELGILCNSPTMGFLTVNPGLVDITPESQSVLLDIRYPKETDGKSIHENAQAALPGFEVEMKSEMKPFLVDPNGELVQNLMEVYRRNTGDMESAPFVIGGGTYAKEFENFVSFGPEMPNQKKDTDRFVGGCHQRDEGIRTEDLLTAAVAYADALAALAS